MSWYDNAVCYGSAAEFFPEGMRGHALPLAEYAEAKMVCAACPVKAECLAHALENDEREGVWGGLTPKERNILTNYRSV